MKSCLGRIVGVVLLVGAAWVGWKWGPAVFPHVERWLGVEESGPVAEGEVQPSPEIAEETLDRFERLRSGEGGERLALGDAELSSVVRYALPGVVPAGVDQPMIRVRDHHIELSARVATEAIPDRPALREVIGFLPDTVDIRMRGSILPFDQRFLALHIDQIYASRIPLPDRFIPQILEALGRQDRVGLPPEALVVPLPDGLRSAFLTQDSLVLLADR